MNKAIDGKLAKQIDAYSIEHGMPSLVLMERAAMEVARAVTELKGRKVAAVCSTGNNGADGLAALRILAGTADTDAKKGGCAYECTAVLVGADGRSTKEFDHQKRLLEFFQIPVINFSQDIPENVFSEYDILVDAVFGIGLSKDVAGVYAEAVRAMNASQKPIVSVDIPSGIDACTGQVRGAAVQADITVAFGYARLGQLLHPGKVYCGRLRVCDVGFLPAEAVYGTLCGGSGAYYFGGDFYGYIPRRARRSNKGNYGKPLIIAGSKDMTGAAFMSGMAAYRTGSGVVTVLTHASADEYLKSVLPEAIVRCYDDENAKDIVPPLLKAASVVVLGPGIGVGDTQRRLVRLVIKNAAVPVIVDADALNMIAEEPDKAELFSQAGTPVIITPHVGEMLRLTKGGKEEIINDIPKTAVEFAKKYRIYCVLKDAVSAAASPEGELFLSTAGNPGMATAGSGDVLTGIMAAVCDWNLEENLFVKICIAVQLHGMAGDIAAAGKGEHSLLARDIIEAIPEVLKGNGMKD